MDAEMKKVLQNVAVIKVNQDPLGIQGKYQALEFDIEFYREISERVFSTFITEFQDNGFWMKLMLVSWRICQFGLGP